MALTLVTPPPCEPLSLAEVKDHLRITDAASDGVLAILIKAARQHLDGRDGILNRALVRQTWDWAFDRFPCRGPLRVPLPPLRAVTSIEYVDAAGAVRVWDPAEYRVDADSAPGRIEPAYGAAWPVTRAVRNAVKIRFVAGYPAGSGDPPSESACRENVPEPIRLAMLLTVGHWFNNREETVVGVSATRIPLGAQRLLASFETPL